MAPETPVTGPLAPAQIDEARRRLEERARTLRDEIAAVAAERAPPQTTQQGGDVADSGDQGEQRARERVRDAEQERDSAELRAVVAALARIDAGRYGECIDCGVAIPWPRLQVQPQAGRCIDCQAAWEHAHPVEVKAPPPGPLVR